MADGTPYGVGKYFTAWLYVKDNEGLVGKDSYFIAIRDKTLDVEVNVAIDDGLWWLHKQAYRYTSGGIDYARWSSYSTYYTSATAESVLAFEIQGHQPIGNPEEDPYVETVKRGLNYVFSQTRVVDISAWGPGTGSPYGDPDTNGNDIGIGIASSQEVYELGMVMMAITASGNPGLTANTGPTGVVGRTYKDILTDMVDLCAWGQNDYGSARGGWRYGWNYGSSDNSVSQWPMMALEAAETDWGIMAASFVKTELDTYWLTYSQRVDGGFGYTGPDTPNIARTGTGIIGLNYVGLPADNPRIVKAVNWLGNNWGEFGNYYGMYAVMKAMRTAHPEITMVGTHDWYAEYSRYLVDHQQADGGWPDYYGRVLATDWAILILTPTVTKPGPVADAGPDVDNFPPTIPLKFDASGSYHRDPTKSIVLYEWDFESDGIWDYSGLEIKVEHAYPAYYKPDDSIDWDLTAKDYTATLRVTDNSDPPLQDIDTCVIHITAPPWKPVADPDGPYEGSVGVPIQLDGSKSYDPESKMYSSDHPWYETIAKYEWDLDNDGQFDDSTEIKPSWTWETPGAYSVGLKVTDSQPSGPGGTIGPLDVDIKYTTVTIKKTEAWSFAVITDLHIGFGYPDYGPEGFDECERMDDSAILRLCEDYYLTDRLTKIVEAINNNPQIKFVVVLGDISDTAEYSEFLKAREILNMLNVPYIPILGNHDVWPYTQKAEQLPSSELLNLLKLLDGLNILDLSDPELRELFQDLIMYWWDPYIPLSLPYPSSPLHYLPDAREDKEQNANSARGDIYFNEIFWSERNIGNIQKIHSVFGNSFRRQHTDLHTLLDTGKAQILMNYVFTYNGVKFIILDCNARKADTAGAQLFTETKEWLKENLKSDEPTIIFSHHPLIFSDLPLLGEQCFSLAEADEIRDIIEASGAIVLKTFGGHTHANFVVSPGYKHSKIIDWEVSIPLTTKKIKLKAGFGVENRLKIDVVITEAVSRESIRWMKWLAQNWEDYSKFPFRSETGKCIRIVTMLGKELVSYSKLDSVAEEPNLPPTSYFTYWPAQQSIKKFTAFPYDPDGNPEKCTYSWDYGGDWKGVFLQPSGGRTPCIRYTKAGVYTATLTVTDGGGAVSRPFSRPVTVHSKAEISTHSPVDLIVTDPEGVVFTKNSSEALGMSYVELDIDGDGSLDDIVAILEPKIGDYLITVIPEPDAVPTDTYTLEVWIDGVTTVLAENAQISSIPTQPYIVELTESGDLYVWQYVFKDSYGRGTTLKINTAHKFFKFVTPDKDYGIRNATYMRVFDRAILINHYDKELRLTTVSVDTKLDFCVAIAWDLQTRKQYFLIDKAGKE